ncbi:MAG: 16S rRNA (guanine(966)-N(2))-methyltransferase RsmD [Elusimicrobia bacterium]|nr:16S rRNA (guanine(966)-N(2))-methyltransferase RsmD [Elusimicrobiota bacterium]
MRIIAGAGRGRRILSVPKSLPVRPISDRMRQSLFDILRPKVPGSHFLDLFAGTGAVGLEALSRGAERVIFVDKDPRCIDVIQKNLERTNWKNRAQMHRGDLLSPMGWIAYRSGLEHFDLIFMGPPYKDLQGNPLQVARVLLEGVLAAKLLAPGGWIVAQHHKKETPAAPDELELFRRSRYGDTLISFFRGRPERRPS